MSFANIFTHSLGCFLVLLTVSLAVQILISLETPSQTYPDLIFNQISGNLMTQSSWYIKFNIILMMIYHQKEYLIDVHREWFNLAMLIYNTHLKSLESKVSQT